jgi:hypothetical protein
MECRQKRQNQVNKQGSVSDSRPSRSSFRIRKTRKQKGTQTEDINFSSSSTSSSATSESCTSSSDDEQQLTTHDKLSHHRQQGHSHKPSSLKHRKPVLSDSNDEYYYTHPPSPQQQTTTNNNNNNNNLLPTNVIPVAQQLIPRGPLICSDSFEKWNDRCFIWNRPVPPSTLLSSAPSTSTGTSESTISITTTTTTTEINEDNKHQTEPFYGQASFLEGDVSDDDDTTHFIGPNQTRRTIKTVTCKDIGLITSPTLDNDDMNLQSIITPATTNFGSSQNLNVRKLSLTESLRSLPTNAETTQNEIFERLRQAEQVRDHLAFLLVFMFQLKEKKRLEVENRAMKQELVRTKSKISSLKREMSSIQQLHLAQQQVQAQLSAPTTISSRQEIEQYHHSPPETHLQPSVFTYAKENFDQTNHHHHHHPKNVSISSNDESLSPPPNRITNPPCSVQSTQTSSRSPPSTISQFSNLLSTITLTNPSNEQQQTRRSLTLTPSSIHCDSSSPPSDEQLRLYLTETLQREKDSAV